MKRQIGTKGVLVNGIGFGDMPLSDYVGDISILDLLHNLLHRHFEERSDVAIHASLV